MITIIAKSNVIPEKRQEFLKLAKEMESKSRREQGCISYTLYENNNEKNQFCYIEVWLNDEALNSHNHSPHFLSLVPAMNQLKKESTQVSFYSEVE